MRFLKVKPPLGGNVPMDRKWTFSHNQKPPNKPASHNEPSNRTA